MAPLLEEKPWWYAMLRSDLGRKWDNYALFLFRIGISLELIVVHGLKKVGIGTPQPELIPNPFDLPYGLVYGFAVVANLVCPVFVIVGLGTRLACVPIVLVTLTGYWVVHAGAPLAERDIPFMFSAAFLLVMVLGGGRCSMDNALTEKYAEN